jgi:hypothetical protein
METKRISENNANAHLELFFEEFISEQKSHTKSINDLTDAINSFSNRLTNIEESVDKTKPISVSTTTLPIQQIIQKGIIDIKSIVSTQQQKQVVSKFQLLLFPEQDATLFYKIVFGRWFLWLVIMLLLTNLYKFAVHIIDKQSEVKLQLLENDRINKSWNYLYLKNDKSVKKLMDNAYSHSAEQ